MDPNNPTWPQIYRNQCSMWHWTPDNSICNQKRRMVKPHHTPDIWCSFLLYGNFAEAMFRKLSRTPNLPGYWGRSFWSNWSHRDSCFLCEYILMMSNNLESLFHDTQISFAGTHLGSHLVFAITATFTVLPTVWLRNMSLLSYLSGGGVVASILVTLCLFWVGMVDGVGFHPRGTALDLANLSVTIGIFGFSYSGHAVFPNIYSSMKEPSKFPSVLIASFVFCFLIYTVVAICGFLMFGDSVRSQFTLDMQREFVASNIALWTVVVNPLSKYALTLAPIAMNVEELLPSAQLRSSSIVIIIRTVLVVSTLLVALTVPFFALAMALMGSSLAMLLAFIVPCACYLSLLKGKITKLQIANCMVIISVGLVCFCIGTYSAIARIAEQIA